MIYLGAIFNYFAICQLGPAIFYSFFGTGIYPVWGRWIVAAILLILALACFGVSRRRKTTVPFLVRVIGLGLFIYGLVLVCQRFSYFLVVPEYMLLYLGPGIALMIDGGILGLFNIGKKKSKNTDPRTADRTPRQANKHGDIFEEGDKHVDIFQ